jgi:hypothetical protein
MDDAGGDDSISIAGNCQDIIAHDITTINRRRDGGWGPGVYELEDGAKQCGFVNCYSFGAENGEVFVLGKQHGDPWDPVEDCFARNCHVRGGDGPGFVIGDIGGGEISNVTLDGFSVVGATRGIDFRPSDGPIHDPTIKNGHIKECDGRALRVTSSNNEDITNLSVENVHFEKCGIDNQSPVTAMGGQFKGVTIENCRVTDCYEGLRFTGATDVTIDGGTYQGTTDISINIQAGAHVTLTEVTAKNSDGSQLVFADGCSDLKIDNCNLYDDQDTITTGRPLHIGGNSTDVRVSQTTLGPADSPVRNTGTDVHFLNCNGVVDIQRLGTRQVNEGWGVNDGDPSTGGQWNGNGFEGLEVRDTTNGVSYVYINGGWV